MRDLTPAARTLFHLAQEVTRARNGRVCTPRDLVFAYVLTKLTTPELAAANFTAQASASPDMVKLRPEIAGILTWDAPTLVEVNELLDIAAAGAPDLVDYLDRP